MSEKEVNAYWRQDSRYYREPRSTEDIAEQQRLYDQAQMVGEWEKSHNISDVKRLTWWNSDFDSFVPKEHITPKILMAQYDEIMVIENVPESLAESFAPNESEQNFAAWMNVTESSRYRWVEDEIYRLNGRGAMYYTGGEDGVYMRISKDGKLQAGNYEGAIPHIGEAMFTIAVNKQFDSFNEAHTAAMEAGGKQFLVDIFSGSEPQPLFATKRGEPEEKPSVLQKIRDAQKAPQQPRKPKEPGQRKNKDVADL